MSQIKGAGQSFPVYSEKLLPLPDASFLHVCCTFMFQLISIIFPS